jgi:hypothetical protein
MDRQDLIDRGDDLAERVAALVLTAQNRMKQWAEEGHLYDGQGGSDLLGYDPNTQTRIEDFINEKLKPEIKALENLLEIFHDLESQPIGPVE